MDFGTSTMFLLSNSKHLGGLDDELSDPKERVRKLVKEELSSLSAKLKAEKSSKIISRLNDLEEFSKAKCVMTYVSKKDEVDTIGLIENILGSSKRVIVPFVDSTNKELVPCEITDLKELRVGTLGVMEPKKDKIRPVPIDDIDLIIVPGRAFDMYCNRLGRGKGHFDRFLKKIGDRKTIVALAFSEQVLEKIPSGENDIGVDILITDAFVIRRCTRKT